MRYTSISKLQSIIQIMPSASNLINNWIKTLLRIYLSNSSVISPHMMARYQPFWSIRNRRTPWIFCCIVCSGLPLIFARANWRQVLQSLPQFIFICITRIPDFIWTISLLTSKFASVVWLLMRYSSISNNASFWGIKRSSPRIYTCIHC